MLAATTTVLLRQTVRAPLNSQGKALVEDDGFLKEHFGECTGLWGYACPHRLPRVAQSREEPDDHSCCHLAGSPWWGAEAACPPGKERPGTERIGGEERVWGRVRDQSVSSLAWRHEAGSWHETGQSSRLCSSVKDS